MKISRIEIKNFRAFKGDSLFTLSLNKGDNLLVYGENGSGKTSLFSALKNFFECSVKKYDIDKFPFRNIFMQTGDCYVKLSFFDKVAKKKTPNPQAKLYEWSNINNETNEQLILEINKTKGFIDYKALLETYFLQQKNEFVNIFELLIDNILNFVENDLTRHSFGDEWEEIKKLTEKIQDNRSKREIEKVQKQIDNFNKGLRLKLDELKTKAQEILNFFGYQIEIEIYYGGISFDIKEKRKTERIKNQVVNLRVQFFNHKREDQHLFLNEAKLSAIAISIFFAALLLQPPSRLRVLALDDVLIGLDMSNRMPILDILDKFFKDFQIFLFTFDRQWYEIIKHHISINKCKLASNSCKFIEFFTSNTDESDLPIYAENKKYLDKAEEYFNHNDYKAAAVYLRTHFELILKNFCDKKNLKVKYQIEARKLKSDDFWQSVKESQSSNVAFQPTIIKIELCRRITLNPLNHADFSTIHKRDVKDAIDAIRNLESKLT